MKLFVGVSAACGSAGNIVEVIDALDFEGYLMVLFDKGKVSSLVGYFGEVYDSTGI